VLLVPVSGKPGEIGCAPDIGVSLISTFADADSDGIRVMAHTHASKMHHLFSD
jgi:hypothetical protein